MPSRRSGKRSSRKEKRAKPEVEDVVEEQSDEEISAVPTTSKRKSRHRKKPSKIPVSSNRKRRKRHASDSSDEGEQLTDYGNESSDNSSSSDEVEVEFEEAADEDEDLEETESVGEENLRKRTYIPRDRDPVYIQNRSFEPLTLPPSSEDLVISSDIALQAFGVYEILRRFAQSLQLTPFRIEDFCCAMLAEENSLLLCEIFSSIMRLMVRESEHLGSWLAPHDEKDSVYLAVSSLDNLTWPELVRSFLQCSSDYASGLKIVEQSHFPCVSAKEKLDLLELLCAALLRLPGVIRGALNAESAIQHEESCRSCQKRGDLICCESCPATFHLECTSPPLKEIPEGEWFCSVCKFNQIPGVFDCITEVEKQNYSLRHEPLGLDRHGRRFAFIARRLLVYDEEESSISYYSTVQQFEEVMALLDPVDLEKELCETLTELDEEIRRHMEVTAKLTKKGASGRPTYLDKADAAVVKRLEEEEERLRKEEETKEMEVDVVVEEPKTDESLTNGPSSPEFKDEEVAAGPRVATRTRTGAIIAKSYADTPLNHKLKEPGITPPPYTSDPSRTFDLSKVVGPLYKLGAEGAFRQYRNIYHESQHAQTKTLKQEERERRRHLAGKFCLPGEKPATTDFRWSGSTLGLCKSVVPTLRSTLLDIEKNIHPAYYHPFWATYRTEWIKSVEKADKPEELALALSRFESSCKPVIFFSAWHEALGCLKWGRYAAVDREEARGRRRDDEEITSRSAKKAYVNFVQGVQHQIWKHKGEEFRLSGRGGVFWWSSRFVEQPERLCSPSTAVPEENVEDEVLDISAAFSSDNSRFYAMDDVLKDQLKKTLKTTDRLMAMEPYVSSPPVVEEAKKTEVAKTDATENVQPKHEIKDGMVNGQATEAEKQAMAKMASGAVSDVEISEPSKPTDKQESADGKGPKEPTAPTTAGIVNLNNPKNVTYKAVLPALLRMTKEEDLMDFFRVSRTDFMVLALTAGLMELPGFKYDYKSAQYWEYPHFPRPNIRTIWKFRTYAVKNWGGVALQMKVLHAGMRWEDLQTKSPPGGKKTRQDESGMCTSEVVKKRFTARFSDFPRSEYLIKREVVPVKEGNQKNLLKSTPGREGLRERKLESPKHREPFTHESWVGEEEVELWEIKSFYDRIEHPPPEPPKPVIRQITPIKNVGPLRVTPTTAIGTIPRLTQHNLLKSTNDTGGQILVQVPGTSKFVMIPSNIANRFPSSTVLQQIVYQYKPAASGTAATASHSEPASDSSESVGSTKSATSQDGQVARLLTEEELQKLLSQAVADGTLSQETLNKLQISYKDVAPSRGRGKTKEAPAETPVSQIVVADAVIVATNERIGKRTQQLRKLLNNRISHMKSVYKKSQTNMHASVLQALVKDNPDLFPGIPRRPKSAVSTGTGEQPVKKRRGRRPTKVPLELDESTTTSPVAASAVEAVPAPSVETAPEDPNAIMLRINKKLLSSPDEPKVTKAKMISTAPKVDETALVNQPPKKRGRKSNKQKMEEAAAAAVQAAAEAAALQKAAEEAAAAAAAAPPDAPSRPTSPVKREISPVKAEAVVEEKEGEKKKKKRKREKEKKKKKRKEKEAEEVQEPEKTVEKKEKKRKRKKQKVDHDNPDSAPEVTFRVEIKEEPVKEAVGPATPVEKKGKKRKRDSDASVPVAPEIKPPAPKKTKQKKGKSKNKGGDEELHCYCKTPYDADKFYVGCDRCEKWFHGDCVGVKENDPALANKEWYCPTCRTPPPSVQAPVKEVPSKKKKKNAKRVKKRKPAPAPEVFVPAAKPAPVEPVAPKPVAPKSSKKVPRLKIKLPGSPAAISIEDLEKSMPAPVPVPSLDFDLPPAIPIKNEPLPKLTLKLKKHKVQKKPEVTVKQPAVPPIDLQETVEEPAPVNSATPTPASVEPVQNGLQKIVREPGKQAKGVRYCFCQELYDPSKGYRKFIKCERCREWYHPRCVGWTSKQADKLRSYKCEACFKNSAFKDSLFRKLSESDVEKLEKMVAQLRGHNQAWPFLTPVKEEEAPGYHRVIREPMDFATVLDKLHNRQYSILQEFLYDCGLIFDNARTFNRENTVYYQCADRMEDEFISKITPFRLGKTSGHAVSANAK